MNLQCGATRPCAVNAVCRVACVGRVDREVEAPLPLARGSVLILSKPCLQKRLRDGLTAVEIT